MKRAIPITSTIVAVLGLASSAEAAARRFDSFKLVTQRPAIHRNRTLHDRIQPLRAEVAACGQPLEGKPSLHPTMKLHVAADGAISDVVITTKNLSDETVECIRKVVGAISYPAQMKPSILTWVLVYNAR